VARPLANGTRAASAFANDDARRAFADAIRTIEAGSAAEVVVSVRHHSGSYLHANLLIGVAVAFATSAFLLYAPYEFSLLSIWLEPFVFGALAGAFVQWLPAVRRWLTPKNGRRHRVAEAARAQFCDKGVRMTSGRTGVLIYVSLLERMVEVVADSAISDALPESAWRRATANLEGALAGARDGSPVATALADLADDFATYLPAADDDVNELPDEVHVP